jgi:hypothetical protein
MPSTSRHVHVVHHRGAADVREANACTEVYKLVERIIGLEPT